MPVLGSAGGGRVPRSKSAAYTANDGEAVLADATSGAFTVTLPASSAGRSVTVKKVDSSSNAVTVTPGSGTIDGAASLSLTVQYASRDFLCDGTNWLQV